MLKELLWEIFLFELETQYPLESLDGRHPEMRTRRLLTLMRHTEWVFLQSPKEGSFSSFFWKVTDWIMYRLFWHPGLRDGLKLFFSVPPCCSVICCHPPSTRANKQSLLICN